MQSGWAYDAEPPAPLRPATQDEQNAVYRFSGGIGGVYPTGGATQDEQQTDAIGGVSDPVHVPAPQRPSPLLA